jgi:hypothetical protein
MAISAKGEPAGVGQHVRGIGEQCQAARQHSAHGLDHHEARQ